MDSKNNENVDNAANQASKPKPKVVKGKSSKKKKINSGAKPTPSKQAKLNNDIKSNNMPNVNEMNAMMKEPQVLEPIYPDQSQYQNQLPLQNTEQVNKQYQLEDIVRKAQTTINFIKALNTTVVKPVIVQEVTTRKPIIAPVNIKTPVNFFEGQPLSEEDLIIQNFFKNTTPVSENSEQYYQNYYSYTKHFPMQQTNNENAVIQSSQIPVQQQQTKKVTITKSVQYPSQQQQSKKVTTITQSVQYPSQQQQQTKKVTITKSVQYPQQQPQQLQQQPQPQIKKNNIPTQSVQHPSLQQVKNVNVNANVNISSQSVQYPNRVQQPPQVRNLNMQNQSIQYSQQQQQMNKVFVQKHQSDRLPNAVQAQNKVLIQKQNFIQNSPGGTTKVQKIIKKTVNLPQNQNVVVQNSPRKNPELTKSLKHVEKVKNITINNTLKETYPVLAQQKQVVYNEQNNDEEDDDDDDKMPRDSIRNK